MGGNRFAYQQAMREGHALSWELKWEAAIERYRDAVAEFPEDVVARNSLATACCKIGRLDDALAQYQTLLKLAADDEGALCRVADIQQRRGDPQQLTNAYLTLADHYLRHAQRAKATQTWLKLSELQPEALETHERLYQAISKAGESGLAGKIGLVITRLRGEQAGKGSGVPGQLAMSRDGLAVEWGTAGPVVGPVDADLLAAGTRALETADDHARAGRPREALLGYVSAAATFMQAGASGELADAERVAAQFTDQCGGVRLRDLLSVGDTARQTVLEVMALSEEHINQAHYFAAIDACLSGIAAVPDYLPLQERLAEAQARQGAIADAVNRYISLSELYLLRRDDTRAGEVLERATQLGLAGIQTWERLASALLEAGMREVAVTQLVALSRRLLEEGQAEEAVRQLERAVTAAPNNPEVLVRWGEALEATERPSEALQAYEQAFKADRHHLEAAERLSIAATVAGAFEAAEGALEAVLEAVSDGGEKARGAPGAYAAALARHPTSRELQLCCGMVLGQAGNWDEAVVQLQQAAGGQGELAAMARLWLGRFALKQGTIEAAIRHLAAVQRSISERRASERGSWRRVIIEFQRLWGEVCLRRGDLEKATAALGEVRRLAPHDKAVCTMLAEVHFRRSDLTSAVTELVSLGDLHREERQPERAATVYQGAMQVAPDNPAPRAKLAEVYLSLGRLGEALGAMNELADVLASNGQAQAAAGVFRQMLEHCRQSDPTRALRLRERIAGLLPDDCNARRDLIAAYLAAGRSEAALAEANRLWQDMVEAGRPREAASALQQVLQIDPWNAQALMELGRLYEGLNERTPAIEAYRRALAIDPENAAAMARLAAFAPGNNGA